jgi:SAM-dependent methyltransferase
VKRCLQQEAGDPGRIGPQRTEAPLALHERNRWVFTHLPVHIERLLDVGCHDGAGTSAFGTRAKLAVGIDTDVAAIGFGRKRFRSVRLAAASAAALPFSDGAFDCVVFSEVLEHVPSELETQCIAEIRRVLRPGGALILTTPHNGTFAWLDPLEMKPQLRRLGATIRRRVEQVKGHKHYRLDELSALLNPYFTIQKVERTGKALYPLAYWGHLLPLGLGQIPPLVRIWQRMMDYDYGREYGRSAYNICIVATAR